MAGIQGLNIDRYLGRVRNRVARVGIELEGGWDVLPEGIQKAEHDGSVFREHDGAPHRPPLGVQHMGELPSEPMEPIRMASWMRKHYPPFVDKTCGLHMHMSFRNALHYQQLMIPEYTVTMLEQLKAWAEEENLSKKHCLWGRLTGEHEYCRAVFWADDQVNQKVKSHDRKRHGHRYTAVNYCWGLLGTVEIRVLPMFDTVDQSIRALRRVLDVTNACLAAAARDKKEEALFGDIQIRGDENRLAENRRVVI